jgi:hypothetical protein
LFGCRGVNQLHGCRQVARNIFTEAPQLMSMCRPLRCISLCSMVCCHLVPCYLLCACVGSHSSLILTKITTITLTQFSGYSVFLRGNWDTANFITYYLPLVMFPTLYAARISGRVQQSSKRQRWTSSPGSPRSRQVLMRNPRRETRWGPFGSGW